MTGAPNISDIDLHAFIDGELPPGRAQAVQDAINADPDLAARVAAYRADKASLSAAFAGIAAVPVPPAWIARIQQASRVPAPRAAWHARPALRLALAASLVLAIGVGTLVRLRGGGDQILQQAALAQHDAVPPQQRLTGIKLGQAEAAMARAVGLQVKVPDLQHLGWQLAELDTYAGAAMLRYRAADGRALTMFVRRSAGAPRFDMLRDGKLRTCVWQDEVVGAVLTGEMSAGQMMRVASAAYLALSL